MTAHAAAAAATMAPRAVTRGAVVSPRCCQASAQCPIHTGNGVKITATRTIPTARTPKDARLEWSGASARSYALSGSMIGPIARPSPSPSPAAHPSTGPAPGCRNCRRHMATASAGPAKAAKTIAGITQWMPTVSC